MTLKLIIPVLVICAIIFFMRSNEGWELDDPIRYDGKGWSHQKILTLLRKEKDTLSSQERAVLRKYTRTLDQYWEIQREYSASKNKEKKKKL